MRICSLLPSATEIAYAIGLGDSILGVSHECDFPAEAATKPSLLRPRVDPRAAPAEIDRQVSEIIARGESIYAVDAELLASLSPDLILTQDLCHVCAASPDDLATALTRFPKAPRVLSLTPRSLGEVWEDVRRWVKRPVIGRRRMRWRGFGRKSRCGYSGYARADSRPARRVPRMARSVLRGRALDSGNGLACGRRRCARAVARAVVSCERRANH